MLFSKNPPRRRFHFSLLFIIREAEVITSFYQVTVMESLETLVFDAIIKIRNNKNQPNENSIHTLISKDCKSLNKKQLLTLTRENKIINKPFSGKNSYFTESDKKIDDLSINNGLLTIEILEIFKGMFKEQQNSLLNIVFQNTTPIQTSLDKLTMEIKDNNDRLNNIMKETDDLKLSIETYQNITDDKLKDTENSTDKVKEREKLRN